MGHLNRVGLTVGSSLAVACFIGFIVSNEVQAQTPARVAFEVASVKVNKSTDPSQMALQYLPGGRFSARAVPLPLLLSEAYKAPESVRRFSINPEVAKSVDRATLTDKYDIEAIAEKDAIPLGASARVRSETLRLMLQALLTDRFKLVLHREMIEQPVYALVVAKGGPKLQRASVDEKQCSTAAANVGDPTSCHFVAGGMERLGINGQAVDLWDLAAALSGFTDRPVINQTGLEGLYNIHTTGWTPVRIMPARPLEPGAATVPPVDPAGPTLFNVLEELGLKLESQKAPVETVVIDHLEKPLQNQ